MQTKEIPMWYKIGKLVFFSLPVIVLFILIAICNAQTDKVQAKKVVSDTNLTQEKPTDWRRLNSNGISQKYTELSGTTREERITSLLTSYGFGEEARQSIRTIARIHKVYPEVIICVAYADSSIGRFLKTEHNYGNVANNDRGDTQSYSNFEQGMNAIGKVLNNRYLGEYISIDQLSRYGNATGMVYATSNENRHINLSNCLGMIRNKRVPDNFAFRF